MKNENNPDELINASQELSGLTRRDFIKSATAAAVAGLGAGAFAANDAQPKTKNSMTSSSSSSAREQELKVAIVGVGRQGYNLLNNALRISGIRFAAVCDIWPFHGRRAINLLKKYNQAANLYEDYDELLAREKGIDAIVVAVPDWMHAPITVAALRGGIHVYCEKEMSNTLAGAREMVLAARQSGKLLQIGHQRRSEPRYHHALRLIEHDKILGKLGHCEAQWCNPVAEPEGWPRAEALSASILQKYGYGTMDRLVNWHWYKKFSGGPICDLGSHQIDIFNWFLKTTPAAVMADGGSDYYPGREWYDNVTATYEYKLPTGTVRANYLLSSSNGFGGFWELFRGDEGTLQISENEKIGSFWKEPRAQARDWEAKAETTDAGGTPGFLLKIGETLDPSGKNMPVEQKLLEASRKPGWQLHLENFFQAVRDGGKTSLNCPPEEAYKTCVTVMKVNEAFERHCKLEFTLEEFEAEKRMTGSTKVIKESIMLKNVFLATLLPAKPERLFDMYLDPKSHAAFTGKPVTIESRAGAAFKAFDGMLSGKILQIEPKRLIVQSWRSGNWPAGSMDSTLILSFWPQLEGGRIELAHINVPEEDFADISQGWEKYYWAPWRAYLLDNPV